MLSLTATCGLLLLFHVIATHGALVSGLLMTLRQFVSVVCNALWFGNMTKVSPTGWASIGFVAAGVWIKMDRRYDDTPADERTLPISTPKRRGPFWIRQYVTPLVACPLAFMCLTSTLIFLTTSHHTTSEILTGSIPVGSNIEQIPVPMQGGAESVLIENTSNTSPVMPPDAAIAVSDPPAAQVVPENAPPAKGPPSQPAIEKVGSVNAPAANKPPQTPQSKLVATSKSPSAKIDASKEAKGHRSESGHTWDDMLVNAVDAVCPPGPVNAVKYNTTVRTAIATYPRSGSSYTR